MAFGSDVADTSFLSVMIVASIFTLYAAEKTQSLASLTNKKDRSGLRQLQSEICWLTFVPVEATVLTLRHRKRLLRCLGSRLGHRERNLSFFFFFNHSTKWMRKLEKERVCHQLELLLKNAGKVSESSE